MTVTGIELAPAEPASAYGHTPGKHRGRAAIVPSDGGERLTRRRGYPPTVAVDPVTIARSTVRQALNATTIEVYLPLVAASNARPFGYRFRWQAGQEWLERFMNLSRTIGAPQRGHGCPVRP